MQVAAHLEAIGLFKGFAANGDGNLRAFASETLPLLEAHLEEIEAMLAAETPA
jgi:predicted outer membrane protein